MCKFSLVIPVFQTTGILRLFLDSLFSTLEYASQIIFINDGSGYETRRILEDLPANSYMHKIELITHEHSMGCVYSINEAFGILEGIYTVILDSDIILTLGWQTSLLKTFEQNRNAGGVGAKLVFPQTGGLQNCGLAFSSCMIKHLYFLGKKENIELNEIIKVQSTVFAFCAIPTKIIRETGLLDTDFFNGNEDVDYQLRIGKLGYDIIVNTDITVYHWEKSNGVHRAFNQRNNICNIWKKHRDFIKNDIWDFIGNGLCRILPENADYVVVDLSESKIDSREFWNYFSDNRQFAGKLDYSHICAASMKVWLAEVMPSDSVRSCFNYLFLCDSFIQLCENSYWYDLRKNFSTNDIIVDFYGNVMLFNEVCPSFWPGGKTR